MGQGVNVEMGELPLFTTLQFNCIYCMCVGEEARGIKFPLLHFGSSVF